MLNIAADKLNNDSEICDVDAKWLPKWIKFKCSPVPTRTHQQRCTRAHAVLPAFMLTRTVHYVHRQITVIGIKSQCFRIAPSNLTRVGYEPQPLSVLAICVRRMWRGRSAK